MVAVVLDDVVVHVDQDPAGEGERLGQGQHIEGVAGQLSREGWASLLRISSCELGVTSLTKPHGTGGGLSEMSPHKIHVKNGFYCPVINQVTCPRVPALGRHKAQCSVHPP